VSSAIDIAVTAVVVLLVASVIPAATPADWLPYRAVRTLRAAIAKVRKRRAAARALLELNQALARDRRMTLAEAQDAVVRARRVGPA
jgi:hypothetical protein